MFSGFFSSITNWVSNVAGDAVGAIAGAAIKGAITGAVIGAAISAVKGEDIKDGAMQGMAYGGIAGGIAGSISHYSGTSDLTTEAKAKEGGKQQTSSENVVESLGTHRDPMNPNQIDYKSDAPTTTTQSKINQGGGSDSKSYWSTNEGKKSLIGMGKGLVSGASDYLSKKDDRKAAKKMKQMDIAEQQRYQSQKHQAAKDVVAANQPGQLTKQTAKITPRDTGIEAWWGNKLAAKNIAPVAQQPAGLLA